MAMTKHFVYRIEKLVWSLVKIEDGSPGVPVVESSGN